MKNKNTNINWYDRPYLNLKNTDLELVAWVSFWMFGFISVAMPGLIYEARTIIRFFFSWSIISVVPWSIVILGLTTYLFKQPKEGD